jgi:hypothetical protein
LDRSALHQSGEIANRCNHLRFEEDDQLNGDSTAAFRMDKIAAEVEVASALPGSISGICPARTLHPLPFN